MSDNLIDTACPRVALSALGPTDELRERARVLIADAELKDRAFADLTALEQSFTTFARDVLESRSPASDTRGDGAPDGAVRCAWCDAELPGGSFDGHGYGKCSTDDFREARLDSERLDWLESTTRAHEEQTLAFGDISDETVGFTVVDNTRVADFGIGPTLRAAIDNARNATPETHSPASSPVGDQVCGCDFDADSCKAHEWIDGKRRLRVGDQETPR